jgi:hypothetical protein
MAFFCPKKPLGKEGQRNEEREGQHVQRAIMTRKNKLAEIMGGIDQAAIHAQIPAAEETIALGHKQIEDGP